jgi:hypothetical protein
VPAKTVAARIEARIHVIRGERVILDADLAALYGVTTKTLNQAVRRNRHRFPADFMFRVAIDEAEILRSQFATSSPGYGGRRYLPYAFTEHGVAMLSSVLRSERAIAANILIIRTFVQLRHALNETARLGLRIDAIERRVGVHGAILDDILEALRSLEQPRAEPRREIGFRSKS